MNIEIANRLVELRKQNNLSQEDLAEKLGISRQAVSKWERAESSPDTDNLISLSRLYKVSLDDILKTDEEIIFKEASFSNYATATPYQEPVEKKQYNKEMLLSFPYPIVCVIIFLLLGFIFDAWNPGWIVFLTIPIFYCVISGLGEKTNYYNYFSYPVICTIIFLLLGFFFDAWNPGWIVFLTIPIFYSIIEFRKNKK